MLKAGENTVTIDCSKVNGCNDEAFRAGLGLVLRFEQDDIVDYSYVSGYTLYDYDTVLIVSFSVGILIILTCIYDTVSKIIIFNRVIKSTRKK